MDEVNQLISLNKQHSDLFIMEQPARYAYRKEHPTEIFVTTCMDGRPNLSVMTKTPLGIIQPYRNIGGKFNFGWQFFGGKVLRWVKYSFSQGRDCIFIATYHFAKGSKHRGCAGFNYDTEAAQKCSASLCKTFKRHHIPNRLQTDRIARAIQVGIDTDNDALILHGDNGEIFDLADELEKRGSIDDDFLFLKIKEMYPLNMPEQMRKDLARLIRGNIERIEEIKKAGRIPEEVEHNEDVLCVGLGFDWLYTPNKALIISPFDPNLNLPIITAGNIIDNNNGVQKAKSIVLITSARFREEIEKPYAEEYSLYLRKLAVRVIAQNLPDLHKRLYTLAVTLNMNTRRFDMIEISKADQIAI